MKKLNILNRGGPEYKVKNEKHCFSCYYYEALNIATFLKDIASLSNFDFARKDTEKVKNKLKEWSLGTQINAIKVQLIEGMAVFCAAKNLNLWKEIVIGKDNHR